MQENSCEKFIINNADGILSMHVPTLTYNGKQELWDKSGGLDSNIYNFLKYSHNGYNVLEIALNMFMSVEETSKLFVFCLEQKLIEIPEAKEIVAMAEFISGKIPTGQYFLKNESIDIDQLEYALAEQRRLSDRGEHILIGKMFINLGYVTEETVKTLFRLKTDAKKRFVLNPEMLPDNDFEQKNVNKLESEIKALKEENQALKKTMSKIINAVKTYDI